MIQLKTGLHPRNRHRNRYAFPELLEATPELAAFLISHPGGGQTIDFADPAAVMMLNRALLRRYYGVRWWALPDGYLCPPIPGRADYLHIAADLLSRDHADVIPRGPGIRILDIGVGANCVFPIVGVHEYGWTFLGSEIDPVALDNARRIVSENSGLKGAVECRLQKSARAVLSGVVHPGERFALSICNPPFHASAAEAAAGTQRKLRNLGGEKGNKLVLNFGGRGTELWCEGGELGFLQRMIAESAQWLDTCVWYTSYVSKASNVPAIFRALDAVHVTDAKTFERAYGQKKSRIVAWSFLSPSERIKRLSSALSQR